MVEFTVMLEKDEEGWYVATVPELAGCYTQGRTIPQVLERIKEAIEVCLEGEDRKNIHPLKFVGLQRIEIVP